MDAGTFDAGMESDAGPIDVTYQMNAAHSGGLADPGLQLPLQSAWSVTLNGRAAYPLIAEGLVFVTVVTGAASGGSVIAFHSLDGAIAWGPQQTGGAQWSHLAYDDGRLFVINDDGVFAAFDAMTGSQLWLQTLNNGNTFVFDSVVPVAADGLVFITDTAQGSTGDILVVRQVDGSLLWTGGMDGDNTSSATVGQGLLFTAYICNLRVANDEFSGAQVWANAITCSGGGQGLIPVLYGGRLYFRGGVFGNGNFVLDAATGTVLGSFAADPEPAFWGSNGYELTGGTLQSFDVATNTVGWMFMGDGALSTAPIVVNGVVFVGSQNGTLFAVDGDAGTTLWSGAMGAPMRYTNQFNGGLMTGLAAGEGLIVTTGGTTSTPITTIVRAFASTEPDAGP